MKQLRQFCTVSFDFASLPRTHESTLSMATNRTRSWAWVVYPLSHYFGNHLPVRLQNWADWDIRTSHSTHREACMAVCHLHTFQFCRKSLKLFESSDQSAEEKNQQQVKVCHQLMQVCSVYIYLQGIYIFDMRYQDFALNLLLWVLDFRPCRFRSIVVCHHTARKR